MNPENTQCTRFGLLVLFLRFFDELKQEQHLGLSHVHEELATENGCLRRQKIASLVPFLSLAFVLRPVHGNGMALMYECSCHGKEERV